MQACFTVGSYLLVVHVVFVPTPDVFWIHRVPRRGRGHIIRIYMNVTSAIFKPDEHEANSTYVRAVAMIEDTLKLLLGYFHRAQLVHETIGGRNDTASANASHSAAHTRLVGGFLQCNLQLKRDTEGLERERNGIH